MTGPRFKLSRRLGANIYGHPKALKRADAKFYRGSKKLSNYGRQLLEKQRLRAYYGLLEKQFKKYVDQAMKSSDKPGTALMQSLECRLDNMVYRMGFAKSIREARQMVNHNHIRVNGRKVTFPSYGLSVGDVITLREKSKNILKFREQFSNAGDLQYDYIEKEINNLQASLISLPTEDKIPIEINLQLVIEFYSR